MIRIMTATEPQITTITVDGDLAGEHVTAVEMCVKQALAQGRQVLLFLRDVATIDESGRSLLARLAAMRVRLRATGVYCSYVVSKIISTAA